MKRTTDPDAKRLIRLAVRGLLKGHIVGKDGHPSVSYDLAFRILRQAVIDYIKEYQNGCVTAATEEFFASEWFRTLSMGLIEPDILLHNVRKMVDNGYIIKAKSRMDDKVA